MSDQTPVDPFDAEVAALLDQENQEPLDVTNRIMMPFQGLIALPEGTTIEASSELLQSFMQVIQAFEGDVLELYAILAAPESFGLGEDEHEAEDGQDG